jgi:hypothetical protein
MVPTRQDEFLKKAMKIAREILVSRASPYSCDTCLVAASILVLADVVQEGFAKLDHPRLIVDPRPIGMVEMDPTDFQNTGKP